MRTPSQSPLRLATIFSLACFALLLEQSLAQDNQTKSSIEYIELESSVDAPAGLFTSAAIVDETSLVHTRQILASDVEGQLVGAGSPGQQIQQVLDNLETVLNDAGSNLDQLVRVNIYALSAEIATSFHQQLVKRVDSSVRPATTSIQTPLPLRGALIAIDAVATSSKDADAVQLHRCAQISGNEQCADAAVLPAGGIAYLSGHPEGYSLTELPATKSMTRLMKTLEQLQLDAHDVVQVKVFLNPVIDAQEVLREVQRFFPDQLTPPVVFVEWLAKLPIEIEMIARLPTTDQAAPPVEYYDPPEFRPSNAFSRVALMRAPRQIYLPGLYAKQPSRGQPQADLLFGQLDEALKKTGSDMRHLVKATYYVSDNDAARWVDRTRPKVFDPVRPPAASKLMIHAVGHLKRTMTIDMIAIPVQSTRE